MKVLVTLVMVSMFAIFATPVWAATAIQVYTCEQDEDASDDAVLAAASAWIKAAKTVKGGENLALHVNFPVAAEMGEGDFLLVLIAPSLAEWGTFTDNYEGSAAAKVDKKYADIADCPNSSLWESIKAE